MPAVSPKDVTTAPDGVRQRWDINKPGAPPAFADVLEAGYELNMPELNIRQRADDLSSLAAFRPDPEFDPLDMMHTQSADRWEFLRDSMSKPEWDARVNIFERDDENRRLIEAGGWAGILATVAGTAFTPVGLASLAAFPVIRGATFAARAVKAGTYSVGAIGMEEMALRGAQPGRTDAESAFVIGGAALLGGLLGGVGRSFGKRMGAWDIRGLQDAVAREAEQIPLLTSKGTSRLTDFPQALNDMKRGATVLGSEYALAKLGQIAAWEAEGYGAQAIVRALEGGTDPKLVSLYTPEEIAALAARQLAETKAVDALMGVADDSVGAARVQEDFAKLRGGAAIEFAASMYPAGRLAAANAEFRDLGMGIVENVFRFVSSQTGLPVAMREAAETRMKRWTGSAVGQARRVNKDAYNAYRTRMKAAGMKPIGTLDFRKEAGLAIQNGTTSIPEAALAAKGVIENVFKPMFKEALAQRLLDPLIHQLATDLADMGVVRANKAALKDLKTELRLATRGDIKDIGKELNRLTAAVEETYKSVINDLKLRASMDMTARLAGIDAGDLLARKLAVGEVVADFDPRIAAIEKKKQTILTAIDTERAQYRDAMSRAAQLPGFKIVELEKELAGVPEDPTRKLISAQIDAAKQRGLLNVAEGQRADKYLAMTEDPVVRAQWVAEQTASFEKGKAIAAEVDALKKQLAAAPENAAKDAVRARIKAIKDQLARTRTSMKEVLDETLIYRTMDPKGSTSLYNMQLNRLTEARAAELETRLSKVAADDAVNRKGVIKQVDREYRDALRQIRKQSDVGQRILLKTANKQRRAARSELKVALKEARADADAAGLLLNKSDVADATMYAIVKDIPENYWAPEIADTVRAVRGRMNSPEFHDSYLPRMYDQRRIREDGGVGLRAAISNYYQAEHELAAVKANEIADEAYIAITGGNAASGLSAAAREVGIRATRASMQMNRVLDVPDRVLAPWLHHDIDDIAAQYARKMGSRIELSRTSKDSGNSPTAWTLSSDIQDARQRVREQQRLMKPKEAAALGKRAAQWEKDVLASASRLTGEYDRPADPDAFISRLGSVLKHTNYMSRMGGILFSSLSDVVAPVVALGISQTYGKALGAMANGSLAAALKMSKVETQKAGTALDLLQPILTRAADDIEDPMGTMALVAQTGAHLLSRTTGFSHWNAGMKMFAGLMVQDKLLGTVGKLSQRLNEVGTGGLTKRELIDLSDMAQMGLDENMIRRMAAQPTVKHGKLTLADSDTWTDAAVVSSYRSAIAKAVDSIIVTPGVGDAGRFIKGPTWKLIMQFQSFNMAAHNRVLIPLLQNPDMARQISAVSASMAVGAAVFVIRETQRGRSEELKKAIDEGDYFGLARGVANNMAFLTTYTMADEKVGSFFGTEGLGRYPSSGVVGQFGPTAGAAKDVFDIGKAVGGEMGLNEGSITASTTGKLKGLLPFQNHPAINLLFNETWMGLPAGGLKQNINDSLGLKETKR